VLKGVKKMPSTDAPRSRPMARTALEKVKLSRMFRAPIGADERLFPWF